MCPSEDCPLRRDCYRNEASGTKPRSTWQSYSAFTWQSVADGDAVLCDDYVPARAALATGADRNG
ncbi:hypothetical protein CIW48_26890 [Methylobacterium sp. P1-11]|uniref:hypothetical protein n=1 Tax=Methylobacterium sp. P1-11 TaxID=2024616 RepID=UPI0011ED9721|nr:hypothetical protein [Methylobacterium sp. P1-11]KAA0117835.1 hypothetical protein CIW48_26890 [Methylobacterium sp. P1-11]